MLNIAPQNDCTICVGKLNGNYLIGYMMCGGGAVTKLTVSPIKFSSENDLKVGLTRMSSRERCELLPNERLSFFEKSILLANEDINRKSVR